MRSFIILLLISILFSGCGILPEIGIPGNEPPFSHHKDFTIVEDDIFIETIEQLDTPGKICLYMEQNFLPAEALEDDYNPYQMFQLKQGNCADYACFAAFIAHYHSY
ncbi:MAG: hypothetical protein PHI72_10425 [Atribacterota bacterium]|nr:hypothetical protein [Atribacterota bacterium]MDD5638222.1 hypothetical protein [Atribacterota bacterium]